jgi:hypothetical protein
LTPGWPLKPRHAASRTLVILENRLFVRATSPIRLPVLPFVISFRFYSFEPPFFLKFHFKNAEIKCMTNQEKAYIKLNKYFQALQFKITKYLMAGQYPPDYLQQKFEDTKRRLRIYSKARNK